ncbi:MAG: energy-coupling factor transporter ATPase [Bacilli bacterium]|nr:energy-coupling factor transporter ATPase [Bacilli bacterium]
MKAIEVKNLTYSYDESKEVLRDFSFSVEEGEYVAIIGHNGSGKSTLVQLLAGLLSGYKGEIKILETLLEKSTLRKIRADIGLVFQNPDNQFVGSTIRDDIAFGLENRQVLPAKMDDIILEYSTKVGMEKFLDSAPENLSGGQKQRVAIAGILAMNPKILILDEATSMLDPKGKKGILDLIKEIRKENPTLTVLSITHDVEEAAGADKVLVLNDGALYLEGTPDEVFSHEEELKKIRLGVPFLRSLINALLEQGIEVPTSIKTEEELRDFLCR